MRKVDAPPRRTGGNNNLFVKMAFTKSTQTAEDKMDEHAERHWVFKQGVARG